MAAKRVTYLIFDTRERDVEPFIETTFTDIAHVKKQINVGDYNICYAHAGDPPIVAACIERKTHEDFAASFSDGRYENVNKMLALRAATGCQLYYIIEGAAFPDPKRKFHRVPYANILAAITKMMIRHNIMFVYTKDQAHTATRLYQFAKAYDSEIPYKLPAPKNEIKDLMVFDETETETKVEEPNLDEVESSGPSSEEAFDPPQLAIPDAVMEVLEESDEAAVANVWARLRGITIVFGSVMSKTISVANFAAKMLSPQQIANLRTTGNRPLHKHAKGALLRLLSGDRDSEIKIVSGVRGVGVPAATALLQAAGGLTALCSRSAATMSLMAIPYGKKTAKLGIARAERIRKILHFGPGTEASDKNGIANSTAVNKVAAAVNKVATAANSGTATVNKVATTVNKVATTANKVAAAVNKGTTTANGTIVNKIGTTLKHVNKTTTVVNKISAPTTLVNQIRKSGPQHSYVRPSSATDKLANKCTAAAVRAQADANALFDSMLNDP